MPKFATSKVGVSKKGKNTDYSTDKRYSFKSQKSIVEKYKEIKEKKRETSS